MQSALLGLASLILASSIVACSGPGGGCPWTHADAPVIAPATSCLVTHVENADGSSGPGGCVEPDVTVQNQCASPLVVHGARLVEGDKVDDLGDVTIAPGESKTIELTAQAGEFHAQGSLGGADLEISVATSR